MLGGAEVFEGGEPVRKADGSRLVLGFWFRVPEVEILIDWHVVGLAAGLSQHAIDIASDTLRARPQVSERQYGLLGEAQSLLRAVRAVVYAGVQRMDEVLFSVRTRDVMAPFIASIIGLSLAGSGYMAEIVHGGLLSVSRGQREAATALGCTPLMTLRWIVLPQALKVLIPPMGNEMVSMLKAIAIVSVIAGGDLLTAAVGISGVNYRTIELLIVATIWYLLVITVLSVGQVFIERRSAVR